MTARRRFLQGVGAAFPTAKMHNLTVVTRNMRDFARSNVPVLDPFNDQNSKTTRPSAR
jgi:hypothetical protein